MILIFAWCVIEEGGVVMILDMCLPFIQYEAVRTGKIRYMPTSQHVAAANFLVRLFHIILFKFELAFYSSSWPLYVPDSSYCQCTPAFYLHVSSSFLLAVVVGKLMVSHFTGAKLIRRLLIHIRTLNILITSPIYRTRSYIPWLLLGSRAIAGKRRLLAFGVLPLPRKRLICQGHLPPLCYSFSLTLNNTYRYILLWCV